MCTRTSDPDGLDPRLPSNDAAHPRIGQLAAELRSWMDNWGLGCSVVVSTNTVPASGGGNDTGRVTLYFSHPLMRIRQVAVLSGAEASNIIALAEHHAASTVTRHPAGMGWTTTRHTVRQLRHHFGPFLAHLSAPLHPTRAVCYTLPGAYADWLLIGAWNPML